MGFCVRLFFKELEKRGLTPYLCTIDWFIHAMNGTTLEIMVKMYEKIRFQEDQIEILTKELYQQRFNNKHNLSIDQKVSDEIMRLKDENEILRRTNKIRENYGSSSNH